MGTVVARQRVMFVALFVFGAVIFGETGETPDEVREFSIENDERVFAAFFILVAAALSLLWFAATLRSTLSRAEDEQRHLTSLGFGFPCWSSSPGC